MVTAIKNPENTKVLLKKCKLTPEEAVSQGVNTEIKDTEAENNGVENTEIQNINLEYPDDPRERRKKNSGNYCDRFRRFGHEFRELM